MKRIMFSALIAMAISPASANQESVAMATGVAMGVLGMTKAAEMCLDEVVLATMAQDQKKAGKPLDQLLAAAQGDKRVQEVIRVGYSMKSIRDDRVRSMHSACLKRSGDELMGK